MATLSGTVKDQSGAYVPRLVRVYRRDSGAFVGAALSDPTTGAWSITTADTSPHFAVEHDSQGDPYRAYVVAGLHGNGSNNGTVFTDVVGHTFTRNGTNVVTSTAQSLFGGSSILFPGAAGDYISTADSTEWSFGTGNFDIEVCVRFDASNPDYQTFCSQFNTSSNWWFFRKETAATNKLSCYFRIGGTVKADYIMTNNWSGFSTGTWYKLRLVRSGTNMYMFIDGVNQALTANVAISTNDVGDIASPLYVGSDTQFPFKGYMNDLRITKGIARYTANYTPSSSAFLYDPTAPTENALIYDNLTPA